MLWACVPKATVDENGDLSAREDDVWATTREAWDSGLNSVTKSPAMQLPSQGKFGFGCFARLVGEA